MWKKFIEMYFDGSRSFDGLYDSVDYEEHCNLFTNGDGVNYDEERWELVPDKTWELLVEIDAEYGAIRVLFI